MRCSSTYQAVGEQFQTKLLHQNLWALMISKWGYEIRRNNYADSLTIKVYDLNFCRVFSNMVISHRYDKNVKIMHSYSSMG